MSEINYYTCTPCASFDPALLLAFTAWLPVPNPIPDSKTVWAGRNVCNKRTNSAFCTTLLLHLLGSQPTIKGCRALITLALLRDLAIFTPCLIKIKVDSKRKIMTMLAELDRIFNHIVRTFEYNLRKVTYKIILLEY